MSELLKNDKALVILAVVLIVLVYMLVSALVFKTVDVTVLTATLTGLFGIAVGRTMGVRSNDVGKGGIIQ